MKILDRLPIPEERTSLRFGDRYVTVHRNQILVWVSVHLSGVLEPEENIPRFPALLDTGNNFGFSVQDRHLREWAGIDPGLLGSSGTSRSKGRSSRAGGRRSGCTRTSPAGRTWPAAGRRSGWG